MPIQSSGHGTRSEDMPALGCRHGTRGICVPAFLYQGAEGEGGGEEGELGVDGGAGDEGVGGGGGEALSSVGEAEDEGVAVG